MSDVDPSTEPLLCCVNGDGCNMTVFSPLSLRGESVSFCAPTQFYSFAKQLFGPKRALSSRRRPTHTSLPLPNHCIHSCSSSQPCVSERKQSQISCAGAAAATVPHTRAFSTRTASARPSLNVPDCCWFCFFCPSRYVSLLEHCSG